LSPAANVNRGVFEVFKGAALDQVGDGGGLGGFGEEIGRADDEAGVRKPQSE
jgi:hypothetical protein